MRARSVANARWGPCHRVGLGRCVASLDGEPRTTPKLTPFSPPLSRYYPFR
ncbi:Hypothetical protein I5071_13330 [Sandaracinus amylolyticus]|nr:Hypothetical protein I5071_13330 [Sandaracinus amylolyticus]